MIDDDSIGENPLCEANNIKTSRSGFDLAADSIAHACLFIWKKTMNILYKYYLTSITFQSIWPNRSGCKTFQ